MFSERLLQLREEKKVKQSELAEAIGISRISISNYENGERTPDGEVICKLADYFNVSTDYLLGRTQTPNFQRFTHEQYLSYVSDMQAKILQKHSECIVPEEQWRAEMESKFGTDGD